MLLAACHATVSRESKLKLAVAQLGTTISQTSKAIQYQCCELLGVPQTQCRSHARSTGDWIKRQHSQPHAGQSSQASLFQHAVSSALQRLNRSWHLAEEGESTRKRPKSTRKRPKSHSPPARTAKTLVPRDSSKSKLGGELTRHCGTPSRTRELTGRQRTALNCPLRTP